MVMIPSVLQRPRNVLLAHLPPKQFESVSQCLQLVELDVHQVVYESRQPIRYAYFMESGMLSVVSVMSDGGSIEVGTIGREGIAGSTLLLGVDRVPYRYF